MSLQCSHCHKSFSVALVTETRGKGLSSHIQCPHCQAWLGRNKALSIGKIVGFYVAVAAGVTGYFQAGLSQIIAPIMVLAIMLVGVTHMMDHLIVVEAPE